MAHSKQAKKRIRQNEVRRVRNKTTSSAMRTELKKLMTAVESGDVAAAKTQLTSAVARIDKAAKNHVIHQNAAARKKSQAMRAVNKMGS